MLLVELQEGAVLTMGSGVTGTAQSGAVGVPPEQGSHSCAWPGRTGQESALLGIPWELPSHGSEPAVLGTQGQVKDMKHHPWSCHALGSALCLSKHPHGQTSPVSKILYFLGVGKGK